MEVRERGATRLRNAGRMSTSLGMEVGMQDRRYLLDLGQILDGSDEALLQEVLQRVDRERREKALRSKSLKARAASAGAGLLLQKALLDYAEWKISGAESVERTGQIPLESFSVEELLSVIKGTVAEPAYRYGSNGKPYLVDQPFQFNLSHSDSYVFCGVSEQEIGVDIQRMQSGEKLRLAKRFFSARECQVLEDCEDEEIRRQTFFRMWTRKEACGKLTGRGLADVIGKDLWTEDVVKEIVLRDTSGERDFQCNCRKMPVWEEYDVPKGYRIAVCKYYN